MVNQPTVTLGLPPQICARRDNCQQNVWSLVGLAIRLATKLNLHRESDSSNFPPFEVEMRRRLWWQICTLDVRVSEEGNTDPAIRECDFDTKFPSNLDDAALDPDMKLLPSDSPGRTDMIFSLVRVKISYLWRKLVFSDKFLADNQYTPLDDLQKSEMVEVFYREIAHDYLRHCNNEIPLDFITGAGARLIFAKIKVTVQNSLRRPHRVENESSATLNTSLLENCLEILEHAYELRTAPRLRKWFWLFQSYMEWDTLAYVLQSLGDGVPASLSRRSWEAVDRMYADWKQHTIHNLTIEKRWQRIEELRERALKLRDGVLQTMEPPQTHNQSQDTVLETPVVTDCGVPCHGSDIHCVSSEDFENQHCDRSRFPIGISRP